MHRRPTSVTRTYATLASVALLLAAAGTGRADPKVYERVLQSTGCVLVPLPHEGISHGTCWVIDRERKWVVTNQHVVRDLPEALVYFPVYEDGAVVHDYAHYHAKVAAVRGRVLHREVQRDLALVQLESLPENVVALPLAAKGAGPGQAVHSVGNSGVPDALWRCTKGSVRMSYVQKQARKDGVFHGKVLETESAINQGDSGGPVVNDKAELVGVVMSYESDTRLVSYNVDVSEVRAFLAGAQLAADKAKEAAKAPGPMAKPAAPEPTLAGAWKLTLVNRDGEQQAGECRYGPDGGFVLTLQTAGGSQTAQGLYAYANGVLFMVCDGFDLAVTPHWVKAERFTVLSGGLLIFDRPKPEAVVVRMPRAD